MKYKPPRDGNRPQMVYSTMINTKLDIKDKYIFTQLMTGFILGKFKFGKRCWT